MKKCHVVSEVSFDEIFDSLADCNHSFSFVKDLDMFMADWEFSFDCLEYFLTAVYNTKDEIIEDELFKILLKTGVVDFIKERIANS